MSAPTLYIFAGSNGAGKSTFARAYLTQLSPIPRFLNADELARGLSPLNPPSVAVKAGKLLLKEVSTCLDEKQSFALESTLSGKSHLKLIERAKSQGFRVELHYLYIPSPELAIARIAHRVQKGGHHIPDADVRRRFYRSQQNFITVYGPAVTTWEIWDNSTGDFLLAYNSKESNLKEVKEYWCK